jgi:hypothetical protein
MSEIDWDHRELCPDGACTGLVGGDGVCKVCGKAVPNWGDERMRGLASEPEEGDEDLDEDDDEAYEEGGDEYEDDEDSDEDSDSDEVAGEPAGAEWTERKLCDDGACVGVIGEGGKCTVCGKRSAA